MRGQLSDGAREIVGVTEYVLRIAISTGVD